MMRAMILAAGRGERMGDLTANTPKPLLRVGDHYLIDYAIKQLSSAGVREIIINVSYEAAQIKAALGDGSRYGVVLTYSEEAQRLESGGGIFKALPFFGDQPFIVMSADVITDFPLSSFPTRLSGLAHLIMVDNPPYHEKGDYGLVDGVLSLIAKPTFTFASIGMYHPDLFRGCEPGHFRLTQVLNPAISLGLVSGQHYKGRWHNVGTKEELTSANEALKAHSLF